MSITSGFKKFKNHIKNGDGSYSLQSLWTSAQTVECADGTLSLIHISSVVYEAHSDGTYTIKKDGQDYKVKNALGTALSPGQHVWVKQPMNKLEFMHICGVR